ncbi:hypothetical protein C7E12_21420, partial [Stenotrophomonas maltophilia]
AQLRLGEHLQLRLDYAWPYADGPVTRKDDPRLRQPLPEQRDKYNLASVGLGAQLRLGEHLQLRLDYAWPYADGPVTRKDDPRL